MGRSDCPSHFSSRVSSNKGKSVRTSAVFGLKHPCHIFVSFAVYLNKLHPISQCEPVREYFFICIRHRFVQLKRLSHRICPEHSTGCSVSPPVLCPRTPESEYKVGLAEFFFPGARYPLLAKVGYHKDDGSCNG